MRNINEQQWMNTRKVEKSWRITISCVGLEELGPARLVLNQIMLTEWSKISLCACVLEKNEVNIVGEGTTWLKLIRDYKGRRQSKIFSLFALSRLISSLCDFVWIKSDVKPILIEDLIFLMSNFIVHLNTCTLSFFTSIQSLKHIEQRLKVPRLLLCQKYI